MEWTRKVMENVMRYVEMLPSQKEPLVDQGGLWHAGGGECSITHRAGYEVDIDSAGYGVDHYTEEDLLSKLEGLSVGVKIQPDQTEDLSCWAELEMLQEEDFREDLEAAEIKMMKEFKNKKQQVSGPATTIHT